MNQQNGCMYITKMIYFAEIEYILLYARCITLRFEQLETTMYYFSTSESYSLLADKVNLCQKIIRCI